MINNQLECVQEIQSIFTDGRGHQQREQRNHKTTLENDVLSSSDSGSDNDNEDNKERRQEQRQVFDIDSSWMSFSPPHRALNPIILDAKFVESECVDDGFEVFGMTPPQFLCVDGKGEWPQLFVDRIH